MIIIRKKSLIYVCLIICMTVFVCGIGISENENTIETVALPVTNKVIVLDAGHGIPDERSSK